MVRCRRRAARRFDSRGDPFQLFAPWIVVSEADRRQLDGDGVIVRTLRADHGPLAALVTRLDAQPAAVLVGDIIRMRLRAK